MIDIGFFRPNHHENYILNCGKAKIREQISFVNKIRQNEISSRRKEEIVARLAELRKIWRGGNYIDNVKF